MNTDDFIHALCLWREARGEGTIGMQAVSCVIRNRARRYGISIYEVIVRPWQFSAITAKGDPMLHVYPAEDDPQWKVAQQIARDRHLPDIVNGADHYFNPQVVQPRWAEKLKKVASIGRHDFYL